MVSGKACLRFAGGGGAEIGEGNRVSPEAQTRLDQLISEFHEAEFSDSEPEGVSHESA
jgi:hypothetical protein